MRTAIETLVRSIDPFDREETQCIQETLEWISSGAPLFRVQKPDIPAKHLVSYFLVFDEVRMKVLLVDHKKAQLWLPTGGHVEPNEHPKETVSRECAEELGIEADFWRETPLFITSTVTVGLTAGHTDVSLWYVLRGDSQASYAYDREEFNGVGWFALDTIPYDHSDPGMKRFIEKLKGCAGGELTPLPVGKRCTTENAQFHAGEGIYLT